MFEIGDWLDVPHCNISGMVWFVDDDYITVTIKCELQDEFARCPYNITCVVVPRYKWKECVVHPEKKITSLTQLHKVYVGTSKERTLASQDTSCNA